MLPLNDLQLTNADNGWIIQFRRRTTSSPMTNNSEHLTPYAVEVYQRVEDLIERISQLTEAQRAN